MILRQMHALIWDTLREAWKRKILLAVLLGATLTAGLLLWYVETIADRTPGTMLTALAQSDPRLLDDAVLSRELLAAAASLAFWSQLALTITLLAGAIAPLLSAERNALIIPAPVSRAMILGSRFLGCTLVAVCGIALAFLEVWVAVSMKFHVWHWRFLAGIATTAVATAALLALLVMIQVAVRSAALTMVLATAVALINLGARNPERVRTMTHSSFLADACVGIGRLLPRTSELADWTGIFVNSGDTGNLSAFCYTAIGSIVFLCAASALYARQEF